MMRAGLSHTEKVVSSRSNPDVTYVVRYHGVGLITCTCPGYAYRKRCAHVTAFLKERDEIYRDSI